VFRQRRAQAFQAMYEHLPVRHEQMPRGPEIRYHRRLPYGRLADFTILDTRQYRTDWTPGPETHVWLDPWDGYVAERNKVLAAAQDSGVRNLVVITGDRHQNYALELKRDFANPDSATVGTEFVGTSITSGGNGADSTAQGQQFLEANPHLKFFNSQRGYVRVTVDERQWRSDFRVVPYVETPNAPIATRATYVVEDRHPHVHAS
jgi:alkaline phosphatase D